VKNLNYPKLKKLAYQNNDCSGKQKYSIKQLSRKYICNIITTNREAGIAQLVEQWIENPRVTSSNLVPGI
jgi:hypothetical protein